MKKLNEILDKYPKTVHNIIVCSEVFLRLGFKSDDIYVIVANSQIYGCANKLSIPSLICSLCTQDKEFNVVCGIYNSREESINDMKKYNEYINEIKDIEDDIIFDIDDYWKFDSSINEMIGCILAKGIYIPYSMN